VTCHSINLGFVCVLCQQNFCKLIKESIYFRNYCYDLQAEITGGIIICRLQVLFLTLSEQQYFVWDNASQSTKRQGMLEVWGACGPIGCPWLRLCQEVLFRQNRCGVTRGFQSLAHNGCNNWCW